MINVSVIIPLYNKEQYIIRAINSVLAQISPASEIIIVDDGSTDDGPEHVNNVVSDKIRFISQTNQGVSAARNNGIKSASNELVAFLDADDEWLPNHLEEIMFLVRQFPEAGAYATSYNFKKTESKYESPKYRNLHKHPWKGILNNIFKSSLGDCPLWTSAVAARKEVIISVGGFPVGESIAEDLDTWFRIADKYSIAWSTLTTAIYHQDIPTSAMKSAVLMKDFKVIKTLLSINDSNDFLSNDISNLIAKYFYDCARMYLANSMYLDFSRCCRSMLRYANGVFFLELLIRYLVHRLPAPLRNLFITIYAIYSSFKFRSLCP